MSQVDVAIVGAGPSGLAAAVEAKILGLSCQVLEKASHHNDMIRKFYKDAKPIEPEYLGLNGICEGYLALRHTYKEAFLEKMDALIERHELNIGFNCEVRKITAVSSSDYSWRLEVQGGLIVHSKAVVLATGRMSRPQEPDYWKEIPPALKRSGVFLFGLGTSQTLAHKKILIVGGGDSAVEYALGLSPMNTVTIAHRGENFSKANHHNQVMIKELSDSGRCLVKLKSTIESLNASGETKVLVHFSDQSEEEFDHVLYALGGMSPKDFLKACQIPHDERGEIFLDSTTGRVNGLDGVYVVGDLLTKPQGGGNIIAGFNAASRAIRNIAEFELKKKVPAQWVSLELL